MCGVLLEEAIGTAEAGDAPVLVEARWKARDDQRSGEQQHDSPAEEAHGRDDSGRSSAPGQDVGLEYTLPTCCRRNYRKTYERPEAVNTISVILPTTATAARLRSLNRAVE